MLPCFTMLRRLLLLPLLLAALTAPGLTAAGAATAARTVTVQRGDTLPRIAARSGVSVARLRALNGLKGDALIRGQVLRLGPVSTTRPAAPQGLYTVKRG